MKEGHLIHSPPAFDSHHIGWWKNRMRVYLESEDPHLWDIVENGPLKITKLDHNGDQVEKPSHEYDQNDHDKFSKNARALYTLHLALGDNLMGFFLYETAKEVWDALLSIHESRVDDQLKKMKIFYLDRECSLFTMEEDESIKEMFFRYLTIVNNLASLGEVVSVPVQVRTILECLPPKYKLIFTILRHSRGLNNLSMNELFNKLSIYERELNGDQDPYIVSD